MRAIGGVCWSSFVLNSAACTGQGPSCGWRPPHPSPSSPSPSPSPATTPTSTPLALIAGSEVRVVGAGLCHGASFAMALACQAVEMLGIEALP